MTARGAAPRLPGPVTLRSSTPLVREIRLPEPLAALPALAGLPHVFLLHSSLPDDRSRWSYFGAEPFAVFGPGAYDEAIALWRRARPAAVERDAPAPFRGGLVGCWSYDFGRRLERLPAIAHDDVGWPDVWLAAYDVIGAFEHATGRAWLVADPAAPVERAAAAAKLDAFARRLEDFAAPAESAPIAPSPERVAASTFTPDAYRRSVETVRDHIRRGDVFQANLSQRWTLTLDGEARSRAPAGNARRLLGALAGQSPAPFSAFLDLGEHAVASASPESFLELRGRRIETRPIKGTRPRGTGDADDARFRAALLASEKDRAENVMIVDVLRNDLGRVAERGSVAVPELCALEAFPQVFHLTSTVTATLRDGLDAIDLLHACFPGGSITGAPKIRAMEILETLEPVRRHLYTGAIGWLDWRGDLATSIAIRTAMVSRDAIRFAAGGGIVADSDPDAEYRETLAKAEGLRRALTAAGWPVTLESLAHAGGGR